MKSEIDPQAANAALLMATANPLLGKYWIIFLAAIVGGLVAVSWARDISKRDGAWLMFRSVAFATAFTSLVAEFLSRRYDIPASEFLFPVSFVLAAIGDSWRLIKDKGIEFVLRGKKDA